MVTQAQQAAEEAAAAREQASSRYELLVEQVQSEQAARAALEVRLRTSGMVGGWIGVGRMHEEQYRARSLHTQLTSKASSAAPSPSTPLRYLQKQVKEAEVQLAAANSRYHAALAQLQSERERSAQLEVRLCCIERVAAVPPAGSVPAALLHCQCSLPHHAPSPRPVCLLLSSWLQRAASEAKSELAAANIHYAELAEELKAEREHAAALEVRQQGSKRVRKDHTYAGLTIPGGSPCR